MLFSRRKNDQACKIKNHVQMPQKRSDMFFSSSRQNSRNESLAFEGRSFGGVRTRSRGRGDDRGSRRENGGEAEWPERVPAARDNQRRYSICTWRHAH